MLSRTLARATSVVARSGASAAVPRRMLGSQFRLNSEAGERVKAHTLTKISIFTGLFGWGLFAFEAADTNILYNLATSDRVMMNRALRECGGDEARATELVAKRRKYLAMVAAGETPQPDDETVEEYHPLRLTFLDKHDARGDIDYNPYLPKFQGQPHRLIAPTYEAPQVANPARDYIDNEILARAAAYDAKKSA